MNETSPQMKSYMQECMQKLKNYMENQKTIATEENISRKIKYRKKSMISKEKLPFQMNYYAVLKLTQENLIKGRKTLL